MALYCSHQNQLFPIEFDVYGVIGMQKYVSCPRKFKNFCKRLVAKKFWETTPVIVYVEYSENAKP